MKLEWSLKRLLEVAEGEGASATCQALKKAREELREKYRRERESSRFSHIPIMRLIKEVLGE